MPFGIHKHSNRSKQALNEQGTATPASSASAASSGSPVFAEEVRTTTTTTATTSQPQAFSQQPHVESQSQSPSFVPDIGPRSIQTSRADIPTRSQSTRYPSSYQPAALQSLAGGSADDLGLDARKNQHQQQAGPNSLQAPVIVEPKKSKSLFDRMRSGSSRTSEQKAPPPYQRSYNNTAELPRRLSKKEPPLANRTGLQGTALDQQQRLDWQSGQDSRAQLPSPKEDNEDDSGLDPYLISGLVQADDQYQTIRPVQNDTESEAYPADDDTRQQFETQQFSHNQALHQQSELGSQNYYHSQNSVQSLSQVNPTPSSLTLGDPYRQHTPETVSQISYDSPIEQQRDEDPISIHSSGPSPTGYTTPRQEHATRTSSGLGSESPSQYTAMAPPPAAASQQSRRSVDTKQTLQGAQGQGQPESRDGPPPNYSRGQFSTSNWHEFDASNGSRSELQRRATAKRPVWSYWWW